MNKNCKWNLLHGELIKLFMLLLAAGLLFGGQSFAQLRIVGAISGTVQDPSGAVVPGAGVVLKDEGTGIKKETVSTAEGTFFFPDLAHGLYEVTVTMPGFQTSVVSHISVQTSQTTDMRVKLVIGAPAETVTVQGVMPVLETTAQLVTTTQDLKLINELPGFGRSGALALARLQPGMGSDRYNNLPGGAMNVTVDGINNASNGWKSGGTVFYMTVPVRLGALEEISVETGGLGADSGAQSGANVKFVTRRGTNRYHGSLFYEPSSEKFNANSWSRNAQGLSRTRSRRHDYGGSIGGPLLPFGYFKEKMFFFVNFERSYAPIRSSSSVSILTPEAQSGIYSYILAGTTDQVRSVNVMDIAASKSAVTKLDPVAQTIIALNNKIPQYANKLVDTNLNTDTYEWSAENNDYAYYPTTRFDYYITSKHQFTWTWNYRHNWQAGAQRLPLPEVTRTNPFRLGYFIYAAALQSTLTPRTLNEFRYGVQHSGDSNRVVEYGPYYIVNNNPMRIGGSLPLGATVPMIDQSNTTGRHYITTMYDTVTMSRGEHNITFGFSYRKTDWNDQSEVFQVPSYSLGTPSGDSLPNTLFTSATVPGIISTALPGGPAALYNTLTGRVSRADFTRVANPETMNYDGFIFHDWARSHMGGLFAQDRWRIRPTVTLNYGLRWEMQGDIFDVRGLTASPDIKSLFGPSMKLFTPGTLSGNNDPTVEVGRQFYKPDYNNFAPNFGVAWNPNFQDGILGKFFGGSKTVLRGSYSVVVYDEGTRMASATQAGNAGKQISANLIPGQGVLPTFLTLSDIASNPVPASAFTFATTEYKQVIHQADQTFSRTISGIDPNLRAPYTINWSLGIQRELMKNTVLEVRYVGNQAHGSWRTSNLNEVNIFENGFLEQFKIAKANLDVNRANGKGNTFLNNNLPGQQALPIFEAAFGARGSMPAISSGSGFSSTSFINSLDTGAAGTLATTLATDRNYVCRMFGNTFSPCTRIDVRYDAPGVYPVNLFLLNPYVAGRMNYVDGSGWYSYNAMQVQLRKRYSYGLDWTVNYTWSKSLTNLPANSDTMSVDWTTLRNKKLDKRLSLQDIPHSFQTFGTYELPIGRGRRFLNSIAYSRFLDPLIGGWTLGSTLTVRSGTPVLLSGGFTTVNNSNNPFTGGVRLAPGVTLEQIQKMFDAQLERLVGRASATDLQRLAVDPALVGSDGRANPAYLLPNTTPGEFGQALFLRNRNDFSWNASLTKSFRIMESVRLNVFVGANNVLNHPSWGFGSTNVYSTSFGVTGAPSGSRSLNIRATLSF